MSATVRDLVGIRSTLAESIKCYYETVIREMDRTPWSHDNQSPVTVSDVAVAVRVRKKVKRPTRRREEERHNPGLVDRETARLYEVPWEEGTEEVPWSQELPQIGRSVVRGAPGGGKTILTQLVALELARRGLAELEQRAMSLDQLPLPIRVELKRLASCPADSLEEALLALLAQKSYGVSGRLAEWVTGGMRTRACCLILDGLDEVAPDDSRLTSILLALGEGGWKCRVILTCRTANYDSLQHLIPWRRTEYELAPFRPGEVRSLINRWYSPADPRKRALLAALEASFSLLHACETPILAALACLANEIQPLSVGTGRRELYQQVLKVLLTRNWRGDSLPAPPGLEPLRALLRLVAWRLFAAAPEANHFSYTSVLKAIAAANGSCDPDSILEYLLARGVLVRAGEVDGEEHYSFLHRTVLEFLAAEHLVRTVRQDGWDKATVIWTGRPEIRVSLLVAKQSWLAGWKEPILFLGEGLGKSPEGEASMLVDSLMKLLMESEPRDHFGCRVCLAAECLAGVPAAVRNGVPCVPWVNRLTNDVWDLYWGKWSEEAHSPYVKAGFRAAGGLNGQVRGERPEAHRIALVRVLENETAPAWTRERAADALVAMAGVLEQAAAGEVVRAFVRVLENETAPEWTRGRPAKALGALAGVLKGGGRRAGIAGARPRAGERDRAGGDARESGEGLAGAGRGA